MWSLKYNMVAVRNSFAAASITAANVVTCLPNINPVAIITVDFITAAIVAALIAVLVNCLTAIAVSVATAKVSYYRKCLDS